MKYKLKTCYPGTCYESGEIIQDIGNRLYAGEGENMPTITQKEIDDNPDVFEQI